MSNVISFIAATFGPEAKFEGRIIEEVEKMESSGMLRAVDVLLVHRPADGGALEARPGIPGRPTLTSEEDVQEAGSVLEPGHAALLLFLEHSWVDRLNAAVGDAGGEIVQLGLLPPEAAQAYAS
jgi:hypothetical protein